MKRAAHNEIQRLTHLQQSADLELELLVGRSYLTPSQESQLLELQSRKRQLEDRVAWFESILQQHARPPADAGQF
jgi:hypothetical protein